MDADGSARLAGLGWELLAKLPEPLVILEPVWGESGACADFTVVRANEAAITCPTLGLGRCVGSRLSTCPPGVGPPWLVDDCTASLASDQVITRQFDVSAQDADGRGERHLRFRTVPLAGAVACGWFDVTSAYLAQQTQLSMDAAAIGMAITSATGEFLYVNQAICRMLRYTREELLSLTFREVTHPDDVSVSVQAMRDMVAGVRKDLTIRKRYLTKGGETVWVDLSVVAVTNADGTFRQFVAQLVNVSTEVYSMAAMQRAVERFRALAENASDIVAELDDRGRIRWVSPSIRAQLGWDPDLLVGTSIVQLVDASDEERAALLNDRLQQGGPPETGVLRLRGSTGGVREYEAHFHLTQDNEGLPRIVVGMHDVTEAQVAYRALTRSEETFRLAMRSAPIGKALADAHGRFTVVNPALGELLGRSEASLIGCQVEDFLPAEAVPEWRGMLAQLGPEGNHWAHLSHGLRAAGRDLWVHHSVSLLRDVLGAPRLYIHQFVDQTATKSMQEELTALATRDGLTGLANRADLKDRLLARLGVSPKQPHIGTGLLFCDVDNLKEINDSFGHLAGDQVLATIANRIAGGAAGHRRGGEIRW